MCEAITQQCNAMQQIHKGSRIRCYHSSPNRAPHNVRVSVSEWIRPAVHMPGGGQCRVHAGYEAGIQRNGVLHTSVCAHKREERVRPRVVAAKRQNTARHANCQPASAQHTGRSRTLQRFRSFDHSTFQARVRMRQQQRGQGVLCCQCTALPQRCRAVQRQRASS